MPLCEPLSWDYWDRVRACSYNCATSSSSCSHLTNRLLVEDYHLHRVTSILFADLRLPCLHFISRTLHHIPLVIYPASIMASPASSQSDPMAIWSLLNPEQPERQPVSRAQSESGGESRSDRQRDCTLSPESTHSSHSFTSIGPYRTSSVSHRRHSAAIEPYPSSRPHVRTRAPERERREFRPTYHQEEEYFIWYHRVDLNMDWPEVRNAYNTQFPGRQRRGFQGIQCKYYRCAENHGVPRVRERNKTVPASQVYGVRAKCPHIWYPWMRPERESRDR